MKINRKTNPQNVNEQELQEMMKGHSPLDQSPNLPTSQRWKRCADLVIEAGAKGHTLTTVDGTDVTLEPGESVTVEKWLRKPSRRTSKAIPSGPFLALVADENGEEVLIAYYACLEKGPSGEYDQVPVIDLHPSQIIAKADAREQNLMGLGADIRAALGY